MTNEEQEIIERALRYCASRAPNGKLSRQDEKKARAVLERTPLEKIRSWLERDSGEDEAIPLDQEATVNEVGRPQRSRSQRIRNPRRPRGEIDRETEAIRKAVCASLRRGPPEHDAIIKAWLDLERENRRRPSAAEVARCARTTPRRARRALALAYQKRPDFEKRLRPRERAARGRRLLREVRAGLDLDTGQPYSDGIARTPAAALAKLYGADEQFLLDLADALAEKGNDGFRGRAWKAIEPLLGAGRRGRIEAIFAALVLEHLRARNGGRVPLLTARAYGEAKSVRLPAFELVAIFCATLHRSRLFVAAPNVKAGMDRLEKRIERLPRQKVKSTCLELSETKTPR